MSSKGQTAWGWTHRLSCTPRCRKPRGTSMSSQTRLRSAVCARNVQGRQVAGGRHIVAPGHGRQNVFGRRADGPFEPQCTLPRLQQPGRGIVYGRPAFQHALHYISWPNGTIQNDNTVYLRPETARGAYINFSRSSVLRKRVPSASARLERRFATDHPSNFLFLTREFELLELRISPTRTPRRSMSVGVSIVLHG